MDKRDEDWVKTQICICKKEIMGEVKVTKGKQAVLLIIFLAILIFSVTATVNTYSKSGQINHNTEDIGEMKEEYNDYIDNVEQTTEDIGDIKSYMRQQTQILKALAREHDIEVTIEP